jgi:hypothetical protein
MQEATGGPSSAQVWSTLRRALVAMVQPPDNSVNFSKAHPHFYFQDRMDLADIAKPGDKGSLEIFRKEGFDFHD